MRHALDMTRVVTASMTSTLQSAPPAALMPPSISSCNRKQALTATASPCQALADWWRASVGELLLTEQPDISDARYDAVTGMLLAMLVTLRDHGSVSQ